MRESAFGSPRWGDVQHPVWSKYPRDVAARGPYGVCAGGYHERSVMRDRFHWARLLALVSGLVNQELLLRNDSGSREPHPQGPAAEPAPAVGCGAVHLGRDRQTTRTQSPEGDRARGQAGYPSRLVSPTGRAEVRRLPESCLSRPASSLAGGGDAGGPLGARKPWLGI